MAFVALVQRFGWRNTFWMLDFCANWAVALRNNDWQPIDAEGYAAYWRLSRSKAFNDQKRWRELWPDEPTPNERILAARAQYEQLTKDLDREPTQPEVAGLYAAILAA